MVRHPPKPSLQVACISRTSPPPLELRKETAEYAVQFVGLGGQDLAHASVFLYHPPFPLEEAISYVGDGSSGEEVFAMPRGWGVLRSRCGLLLWLKLSSDSPICTLAQQPPSSPSWGQELSVQLSSTSCGGSRRLDISAWADRAVFGGAVLPGDQGLLHP